MGALGIPVWCSMWMPILGVLRTSHTIPSRGGAQVTGYDHDQMRDQPLTEFGIISEEQQWENLKYFLERVVPVAEEANVKMAMHPDDPPLSPIRGVARIMSSVENYQKLIDLVPSPVNGIALCQGNFTLMTDDLPSVIRHFGGQDMALFASFPIDTIERIEVIRGPGSVLYGSNAFTGAINIVTKTPEATTSRTRPFDRVFPTNPMKLPVEG